MSDLSRRIVDGIDAALLLLDGNGAVIWINNAAVSLLGPGLPGHRLTEFECREDAPPILGEIVERLSSGQASPGSPGSLLTCVSNAGTHYFWMSVAAAGGAAAGAAAEEEGWLVMLSDISAPLTESPILRSVFSQVSHDIKSPLTSITGACELLGSGRVGALDAVPRRLVGVIEEGGRRILEILDSAKSRFSQDVAVAETGAHE